MGEGPGRGRRAIAFLLSLIQPGAGEFLVGSFRRGVIWAVGVAGLGFALLFALPVGLAALGLALTVGALGHVASAVDTLTLTGARARWSLVLVGWGVLIVGNLAVDPLTSLYRDHYAQAFTIPAGSMMDTLLVGDYILIDKSVYRREDPRRGDIVVFEYPHDERRDFIKRIVALPGEQIVIRAQQVFIDGRPLSEPYVRLSNRSAATSAVPTYCGYAYGCELTTVPAGSYFVMGDNRDNSQDSRYWGFVKREKIKGRAFAIYWSWDGDRHWLRWARLGRTIS